MLPSHVELHPSRETKIDDLEDELDPPQARFSIAVEDDTEMDDSFHMVPPRLSMAWENGEQTVKSAELPRRIVLGETQGRLSRGSFGSIRDSDRFDMADESGLYNFSLAEARDKTGRFTPHTDNNDIGESRTNLGSVGDMAADCREADTVKEHCDRHPVPRGKWLFRASLN